MQFVPILLAIVVALSGTQALVSEQEIEIHFEQFKNDFLRSYLSADEELHRKSIFRSNLEFIFRHNLEATSQGLHTFTVSINNFTDRTNAEFRKSLRLNAPQLNPTRIHSNFSVKGLPDSVDWVKMGAVTPPINQGQCGSSWAIPVVSAVEGAQAIQSGKLVALSNQQMIDCCGGQNQGCNGGFEDAGYQCIIKMGGLDTAAAYPYTGIDQQCKFDRRYIGARIAGWVDITHNEATLQNAIAIAGPVAAAIDASQQSFQFYSSGVYYEPKCSQTVDHGITVVGYGADSTGNMFWQVKNSWGTSWGMGGYILMARNRNNMCGIASMASYPLM